jgi:1,4-dihydroxy-2-naphthoate octaprenyltransferase
VVAAAIPVDALITAILVVSSLRDIETDRPTGKHSPAVIVGKQATRFEYAARLGSAYSIHLVFLISCWS